MLFTFNQKEKNLQRKLEDKKKKKERTLKYNIPLRMFCSDDFKGLENGHIE